MAVEGDRSTAIIKLLSLGGEVFKVLKLGYLVTSPLFRRSATMLIDSDHG